MTGLIKERLEGLGYAFSDDDSSLLEFCIKSVEYGIRNYCNIPQSDELPSALSPIIVDRVCGEFLYVKRMSGQLDISAAVKQIVEGDVSVSFSDSSSDGDRLDGLIDRLINCGERELVRFRRIRWSR